MGDFEDVFGAGADMDDIIDGFDREYFEELREERLDQSEFDTNERRKAQSQREVDAWCASMMERGYEPGPRFSLYEELIVWDKTNKRPHVRRRALNEFVVYFTKTKSISGDRTPMQSRLKDTSRIPYDDIPF